MKINASFLQPVTKNEVTEVTRVTGVTDAESICNTKNLRCVTGVTKHNKSENVTPVTPEKNAGLHSERLSNAAVTLVTPVTREKQDKREQNSIELTTPEQSFFALPCSDEDKALLANAVMLIDTAKQTRPEIAPELIKAFDSVSLAELAGNLADFDFALSVLRGVVEYCG